jgi:hypothetical protein
MFKMKDIIRCATALLIGAGFVDAIPLSAQTQSPPTTQATAATAPGQVAAAATTSMTAKVIAVDSAQRTVTLQSPNGKTRTIKVGDHVQVTYVEALAISVKERPPAK